MAASPLVSVQWLHEHMHASPTGLVILDASYPMPGEKRDVAKDFEVARIRGAQLFGIKNCSDKSSPHPNMLPGADEFSAFVKNFGIGRNSHVVVYDNNSKFGIFSAPRVWWTFRVFGHSRVSVLDGGLPEWIAKGFPTDNGPPQSDPVKSVDDEPFEAKLNKDMVVDFEFVMSNAQTLQKIMHIDARSRGRFLGIAPEPRPNIPSGHIPNSTSFPFPLCLNTETKLFNDPATLRQTFEGAGVDLSKPLITSCGTGITACVLYLAAVLAGKGDTQVYDGSWAEWAVRATPEMIITEDDK